MNDSNAQEAAVLGTMALLSALAAAAEVYSVRAERRAGRDASGQELPGAARAYLREEGGAGLVELLARLRSSLALAERTAGPGAFVRHFDDLLLLNRIGRVLHVVHQRLLSLYPGVSEGLVEEVRRLHGEALALPESELLSGPMTRFVERGLRFAERMAAELDGASPAG